MPDQSLPVTMDGIREEVDAIWGAHASGRAAARILGVFEADPEARLGFGHLAARADLPIQGTPDEEHVVSGLNCLGSRDGLVETGCDYWTGETAVTLSPEALGEAMRTGTLELPDGTADADWQARTVPMIVAGERLKRAIAAGATMTATPR